MGLYDLLTLDRSRRIPDREQRIPPTRPLSRQECLELFPSLRRDDLSGGMVFYDGQMYSPPRLALSFLRSAVEAGAVAANYVAATNLIRERDRVVGVEARDLRTGDRLRLRGKVTLNAAGPWAGRSMALVCAPRSPFPGMPPW
jgi:glycerol-3-phosphate dehydrogenase